MTLDLDKARQRAL